jgi:hypothetical protein
MEKEGAIEIFKRSVERGFRIVKYLGDGDTKAYKTVLELKPYGDECRIDKIECINHVAKRVTRRLTNMKQQTITYKGKNIKLFGTKCITSLVIKKLQSYYAKAIRENVNDLKNMKNSIWATFYHHSDPSKKIAHKYCPDNSWCFYKNKSIEHKELIPPAAMKKLKFVYDDLANEELLKRCLDGLTQNCNEGFNSLIWRRFPKASYSGLNTLKISLYDAIITFNDGYISRTKVFNELGFEIGDQTISGLEELDFLRNKNSELFKNKNYKKKILKN